MCYLDILYYLKPPLLTSFGTTNDKIYNVITKYFIIIIFIHTVEAAY